MSCRNKYTQDIRQSILDAYNEDKTSATLLKPNKLLLPINENHPNKESTLEWAKRVANILYKKYNAKAYGPVVTIDNNINPIGTIVNITIPTKLIDGYERKYGEQSEMFSLNTNKVNYKLKAIKALESDKVRQPKASTIQGFYNDLVKQGITNQQLDIVKDIYKDGMTKEELISSLLAEMSYTVKVNITKQQAEFGESINKRFNLNNKEYSTRWTKDGNDIKYYKNLQEISSEEYENAFILYKGDKPSQHYSDLTVLGGTNYTENEIKTPDIIHSIKGHAQFATDNGIGWFRSDDKTQTDVDLSKESNERKEHFNKYYDLEITKIRRILEVQSDLFQKGRDRDVLIDSKIDIPVFELSSIEDFNKKKKALEINKSKNKFLQLLNKDNNWVTFFVKSIIQDSVKKDYEKVLFPLGDTASKVEGHETISDFILNKQKEVDYKKEQIIAWDKILKQKVISENRPDGSKFYKFEDSDYYTANNPVELTTILYNYIESGNNMINQYEREIEDAKNGNLKISSIAKFYEETIGNILKKQGYNPQIITDKYNNKWYEVTLDKQRDLSDIYLQLSNNNLTIDKKNDLTDKIYQGLESYIKNNSISIEFYDSLKKEYNNDPIAIFNVINNTIKINTNKADITTLPEELGHHLTLALGDENILIKRALNLIKRTNYKEQLGSEYIEIYKGNDELLKKEQLGKLISKTIANKLQNKIGTDENSVKIWDTIKRLIDAFVKLFKPDSNIFNDLQQDVDKLSEMITSGQKINNEGKIMPNLTLFSLSKQSKDEIPVEYKKQYEYYDGLIIKLKNDIAKYKKQLLIEGSSTKELTDNIEHHKQKIIKLQASLDELNETKNRQILLNLSKETLSEIESYISDLENEEDITLKSLEGIRETLNIFKDFPGTRDKAGELLDRLKPYITKYSLDLTNEFSYNDDKTQDIIDENNKQDIRSSVKNFGTLVDIKNYLGRTIGELIKNAQNKISIANRTSAKELKEEVKKLVNYQATKDITGKNIYKVFIQEYRGITVLTKEFSSEFYKKLNDTFDTNKYSEQEGKKLRKTLAFYDDSRDKKDKWVPRDKSKSSGNINENYQKILDTPELKRFYDYFKKTINNISDTLPIDLESNFIPNIAEESIWDILKSNKSRMNKLKEGVKSITGIYEMKHDESAFLSNERILKDEIPIKYFTPIDNKVKSDNLEVSLLKFMQFANSYKEMSEVLPKTRLLEDEIKRKVGEHSNIYKMANEFIKMQVKGDMKLNESYAPYIDFGIRYTSLLRIGLNPFNAASNVGIGKIGNITEALGGRFFNLSELTQAEGIYLSQRFNETSKLNIILKMLNPLMELEDYSDVEDIKVDKSKYKEKFKSIMYLPQRAGEDNLQSTTMIANLLHDKIKDLKENEVSIWEAFDEQGKWKEEQFGKLEDKFIYRTTNKIQRINQMIHGRYSAKDASILMQYSLFRAAFQFKKWIPSAIEVRFGDQRFDDRLGVEIKGRYRTLFSTTWWYMTIDKLNSDKTKLESGKYTETDVYNMRKNLTELVILVGIIGLRFFLAGKGDDDEEIKKKASYKFTMDQLDRMSSDMLLWYDPSLVSKNSLNLVTPATLKTLNDVTQVFINISHAFGDDKDDYFRSGIRKNENKFTGSLKNAIPLVSPIVKVTRQFKDDKYVEPNR